MESLSPVLTRALLRRDRRRGVLRRRQVSRDRVLGLRENHDLIEQSVASGIELQRLAYRAVFLFDGAVISNDVQGKRLFLASTFFSCRLTVETGLFCPFCSVKS